MRRREFISLLGGSVVAWPLSAGAQKLVKRPTIGFLGSDATAWSPYAAAFAERLRALGWIESCTISIEYRWDEARRERDAEIAAEFVHQNVDIIVAFGAAVPALKRATSVIPIIFAVATDPVGGGLVASLARPGGNVTGMSLQGADLAGKKSNFCLRLFPGFVVWQSWAMLTIPKSSSRWAKFRARLTHSASNSRGTRFGKRRMSQQFSRLLDPKRTRSMSWKILLWSPMRHASSR